MNGYSRDLLQERVAVAKRVAQEMGDFGMASGGQQYEWLNKVESDHGFWCKHDWNRGTKALREGAVDAYNTVMFRMDYDPNIDRWCLLQFEGVWYQIQSLNASFHENKIQITAIEMSNQDVTIVGPPDYKDIEIWANSECSVRPFGNPIYVYAQFNTEVRDDLNLENSDYTFQVSLNRTVRAVRFANEWQSNEYGAGQTIPAGSIIQLHTTERVPSTLTGNNFSFDIR